MPHRFHSGFSQKWMPTQDSDPVDLAVPTNDDLANDISLNTSYPCEVWIVWLDTFCRSRPIRDRDVALVDSILRFGKVVDKKRDYKQRNTAF